MSVGVVAFPELVLVGDAVTLGQSRCNWIVLHYLEMFLCPCGVKHPNRPSVGNVRVALYITASRALVPGNAWT